LKWLQRKIRRWAGKSGGRAVGGGMGAASEAERIRANRLIAKVAPTTQEKRGGCQGKSAREMGNTLEK